MRLFQVRRRQDRFQLSNIKILNSPYEECTDRFVVSLKKIGSRDQYQHRGISITSRHPRFLFPELIERCPGSSYFIYVESRIRDSLPEELVYLKDIRQSEWPQEYRAPNFLFPLSMKIEHYREALSADKKIPETRFQLLTRHIPVARTIIDLYPGGGCSTKTLFHNIYFTVSSGAGFRSSQYIYLENSRFESDTVNIRPDWIDEFHVSSQESYIPHVQDGFCGPIVSYWSRVNSYNKWFP